MRLRGIGPEVLLLCFLLVGAAAFLLGRRTARGRRLRRDHDYFTGLDHLVNDRYDRATEVFTRLATKSQEADIQFALGSLMRKRGEVDRAIAIHTELVQNREFAIQEQARFALGLDYLSAGLMDRAEETLRGLMSSARYRPQVLERLAWVYEQQRDWRAALDIWRELPADKQRERNAVAAHYCCELGEAALAARRFRCRPRAGGRSSRARAGLRARRDPGRAHRRRVGRREQGARALRLRARKVAHHPGRIRARGARGAQGKIRGVRSAAERASAAGSTRPMPEPARFRCDQCGVASVTWHWRCPSCRSWDSLQSVNIRVE